MNIYFRKLLLFVLILIPSISFPQNKISTNVVSKQFLNKKLLTIERDIYYQTNGKLVTHYIRPEEYFLVTNSFGEARVYNPKTNEVMLLNEKSMSSRNELIYSFLTNEYHDFGLLDLGFKLQNQKKEGKRIIKTFVSQVSKTDKISKIEMVYENTLPIYSAYFDKKGLLVRKVYYDKYQKFNIFTFPTQITEISYISAKDSIVKRDVYSNVQVNKHSLNNLFDYQIPSSAKLVNPINMPK